MGEIDCKNVQRLAESRASAKSCVAAATLQITDPEVANFSPRADLWNQDIFADQETGRKDLSGSGLHHRVSRLTLPAPKL